MFRGTHIGKSTVLGTLQLLLTLGFCAFGDLSYWFPASGHLNPLEGMLKHGLLGPPAEFPAEWNPVLGWARESVF